MANSIPHGCPCGTSIAIFETTYTQHLTLWHSELSDNVHRISTFAMLACATAFQNFKRLYSSFICEQKYQLWVCMFLVRTKGTFWYQNCFWLCWNFLFRSFTSHTSMFVRTLNQRGVIGKTIPWFGSTGMVDPQVGIFLSPLNTNNGFYLSYIQDCSPSSWRKTKAAPGHVAEKYLTKPLLTQQENVKLLIFNYATCTHTITVM